MENEKKVLNFKEISILKIIKNKKVDVATYIYNTDCYDEYLFESMHLKDEHILTYDEYYLLKEYFEEEL